MVAFREPVALGTVKVAVVAEDPLVRMGLVAGLSSDPGLHVLEPAEPRTRAEVIVWDGAVEEAAARAAPLVALVADVRAAGEALGAGARGVLLRTAGAPVLVSAIQAVRGGLLVLGPGLEQARPSSRRGKSREPLTAREREVLALLGAARSNKEIAQRLGISEHTAKFHVNAVLAKLGVQRRAEAVVEAARLGLISI